MPGAFLYSIAVSMSAMGALNSNVFATAKLAVKASEVGYFPEIWGNKHVGIARDEDSYLDDALSRLPPFISSPLKRCAAWTRKLRWQAGVPV